MTQLQVVGAAPLTNQLSFWMLTLWHLHYQTTAHSHWSVKDLLHKPDSLLISDSAALNAQDSGGCNVKFKLALHSVGAGPCVNVYC